MDFRTDLQNFDILVFVAAVDWSLVVVAWLVVGPALAVVMVGMAEARRMGGGLGGFVDEEFSAVVWARFNLRLTLFLGTGGGAPCTGELAKM